MRASLFRSMLWLHSWVGLGCGWLLFAIFVTGTFAYVHPEISYWAQPQLQQAVGPEQAVRAGLARLRTVAPDAESWEIILPPARDAALTIRWHSDATAGRSEELLSAGTGERVRLRNTLGGDFFYSFHFTLMWPGWGYWLAGAAAIWMLVAVVSGLIAHRKVLADFFTLRLAKSRQRAWLDAHNLTAVLASPFYIMIVYTGLVTLLFSYVPWGVSAAYGDRPQHFFAEAFSASDTVAAPAASTRHASLAAMLTTPERFLDVSPKAAKLVIHRPQSQDATVDIHYEQTHASRILPYGPGAGPIATLHDVLYELHVARFAGPFLRILLVASGAAGAVMIAAGLMAWVTRRTQRRAKQRLPIGARIVERVNVGVLCGIFVAIAAYFWVSRLLPEELEARAAWEMRAFSAVWAAAGAHALTRPARAAWREQLWTAALLFGGLPFVSALTTGRHTVGSLFDGDYVYATFDLSSWAMALGAACIARRLNPVQRREHVEHTRLHAEAVVELLRHDRQDGPHSGKAEVTPG